MTKEVAAGIIGFARNMFRPKLSISNSDRNIKNNYYK